MAPPSAPPAREPPSGVGKLAARILRSDSCCIVPPPSLGSYRPRLYSAAAIHRPQLEAHSSTPLTETNSPCVVSGRLEFLGCLRMADEPSRADDAASAGRAEPVATKA